MKKIIYWMATFIVVICITACSNELELTDNVTIEGKDIEVVEGALKFRNQEVCDSIVKMLSTMGISERSQFYKEIGFKSIADVLSEADDELEVIANLENENEFKAQYDSFKEKYSNFLFNDQDKEDLSPYIGFENSSEEFIANYNGIYYVGNDKIIAKKYVTMSDKLSDSRCISLRYSLSDMTNHATGRTNKRKVALYISWDKSVTWTPWQGHPVKGHPVIATFTCQKKVFFGWIRYSTVYYARFNFRLLNYFNGTEAYTWSSKSEKSGRYSITVGYADKNLGTDGSIEVWSRGVPESNKGVARVSIH